MKLSKDTRPNGVTDKESAQLIAEALPWIKNITGKTIVIKYGGAAMVDPKLRADVMSDIVLLKTDGVEHGCVCLEAGVLIDVFAPYREDFVKD